MITTVIPPFLAELRANGFTVHAFDIEEDAIARCRKRFYGDSKVLLSQKSFGTFEYPPASLIVADASLFFCPESEFDAVWDRIREALLPAYFLCGGTEGT